MRRKNSRIGRGGEPVVYTEDYKYEIGKAITLKEGKDATIIACGAIVSCALEAAQKLAKNGINLRVIDMHTIKPLDRNVVIKAVKETGIVLTGEDHNMTGGLGSAVAEVIAEEGLSCKFKRLGIPDVFGVIGTPEALYHKYGYDADGIYDAVKKIL
jgi:transketolase